MADSKISNLPLSPYVLDKDLMVVVTGYLEDGAYPTNVKVPLGYIRRYIVRLNLISAQVSGIASYYNEQLNILNTWTTGIHAVPGNNIEVQFSDNTPAADKYGGVGPICHSGIISVTGLNAVTENCIVKENETEWPYSGVIYNTGLNAVAGNNIEITYSTDSDAHDEYGGAGGKYQSGIVSTTGLNIIAGTGIGFSISPNWPHPYSLFSTERTQVNTYYVDTTVGTSSTSLTQSTATGVISTLSYSDFVIPSQSSIKLFLTGGVYLIAVVLGNPPSAAGSTGPGFDQRQIELSGLTPTDNDWIGATPSSNVPFDVDSFSLEIGISDSTQTNSAFSTTISPILKFKNTTNPNYNTNDYILETTRDSGVYKIGSIDPMIIRGIADFNSYHTDPAAQIIAKVKNPSYQREYTYTDPQNNNITYSVTGRRCYTNATCRIKGVFLKGETRL